MITPELIQQTESRFAERQAIRHEREAKLSTGAVLEADSPERVRQRVQHVAAMIIETEGVGLPASGQAGGPAVSALERIMGKSDLMSVRYLELGLRVARTVGRPAAVRAVGAANGANPLPLVIPCHRVVETSGHLGGYGGGLPLKRRLLAMERSGELL